MKKFGLVLMCIFMFSLSACSSGDYPRDTKPGAMKEVNYVEMKKMMKSDKEFIGIVTQTNCDHCIKYKKEVITPYLKEHNITLYEFNITNEESGQVAFDNFKKDIAKLNDSESMQFMGTPYTLIMDNKELKEGKSGLLAAEDFDALIVKYQLDKKHK